MSSRQRLAGVVAGALLILSAFAHSVVGGMALRAQLVAAQVPDDLLRGALVGWEFGGAAMLAFGIIVLHSFVRRAGAESVASVPAGIVAVTYLIFGAVALIASSFDPFFLVFIVPGLLLAWAVFSQRPATSTS